MLRKKWHIVKTEKVFDKKEERPLFEGRSEGYMKLFVLYSLVAPCRGAGAEALEDLNEKNENDDRE